MLYDKQIFFHLVSPAKQQLEKPDGAFTSSDANNRDGEDGGGLEVGRSEDGDNSNDDIIGPPLPSGYEVCLCILLSEARVLICDLSYRTVAPLS